MKVFFRPFVRPVKTFTLKHSIEVWDSEQPKASANAPFAWNAADCATAAGPKIVSVSSSASAVMSDVAAHLSIRSESSIRIGNSLVTYNRREREMCAPISVGGMAVLGKLGRDRAGSLGLSVQTYADSKELRTLCERNRNRYYVPEW